MLQQKYKRMTEGTIKFNAHWEQAPAVPKEILEEMMATRQQMFAKGYIGEYAPGLGYGNISMRYGSGSQFLISGAKTGRLPEALPEHFTHITEVYPLCNEVHCRGPVIASSETMSHAMIYQCEPSAQVAIHLHEATAWERLLHQVPTTDASAEYGSVEMSASIEQLFQDSDLSKQKIFVMEGHPEGIFVFGTSFAEALRTLRDHGL
jgi:ribulose-5-phosphate 4-epimerase/fuculose-1-phosphate aldolase